MKLLFVGDVMLGRLVNEALREVPPEYVWGDTLGRFQEADLCFCNLECAVSDRGLPWTATPKAFHFRSDAKNLEVLKRSGITHVSLANNHILDFGYEAMEDTIDLLGREGIAYAGAGSSLAEATRPAVEEICGRSVGLVAFTDNEPQWEAGETEPGLFYVPVERDDSRARDLFGIIERAKAGLDLLIVSAHWGPNWGYRPTAGDIQFGHLLIDAGADIVVGHSPHVCRGVEIYKGKLIIYSAGDFIDDYAVAAVERNDQSFIYVVEIDANGSFRVKLHPTVIRDCQAQLAGAEAAAIAEKMAALCDELGTDTKWNPEESSLVISSGAA